MALPPAPTQCCSLGALSGIAATVAFPPLHRRLGLVALGGLSIWLQLGCLLGGVAPEAAAALGAGVSARARMYALVWGLVLSRFGLWSFDLAVNQLIQEAAEHSALATVMGVQGSLQSLCQVGGAPGGRCRRPPARVQVCAAFAMKSHYTTPWPAYCPRPCPSCLQMLAYLGGVLVPATGSFVWLMAGSCGAVGTAAALYTAFALRSGCGRGMERQPAPLPA